MHKSYIPMLHLQLFAEGGDGGTAQGTGVTAPAAGVQNPGVKGNPLADVKYGVQQESAPAAGVQTKEPEQQPQTDPNAEFEALIKGRFKQQYDAKMQDTIQKRLKASKETADRYAALQPVLEILGKKHGVDASDIAALQKAIEDDDSYFEDEAMERGVTVQELKRIRAMERENAELHRQIQEQQTRENATKIYSGWLEQAEAVKAIYPSFNLETEMQNQQFADLLRNRIDVRTAFEVVHRDEILPAAMQYAAKTAESKVAKAIAAGGARPVENGMSGQSAAVVKSDVSKLSKADINEIARRVARGERISFG